MIGRSDNIIVDDETYSLSDYKNKFNIDRSLFRKQIVLESKVSEISNTNKNPKEEDVISFLKLLKFTNIIQDIKNIYLSQNNIETYKKVKGELLNAYGGLDSDKIEEEIYLMDRSLEKLNIELKNVSEQIKKLELPGIKQDIISEYSDKNKELKRLKLNYEKNKLEYHRLEEFIENFNKVDLKSNHILKIYKKSKIKLPEKIGKKLEEVEKFHLKVFEERKEF